MENSTITNSELYDFYFQHIRKSPREEAKEAARNAIQRAIKGVMYGADMESSSVVCFEDAISLLQKALVKLQTKD